jgi:uroporphyrinogen decarboxylase
MNSRERVRRAVTFQQPDRIPLDLWTVPGTVARYGEDLAALLERFPLDMGPTGYHIPWECDEQYLAGEWRDPWGVVWNNSHPGLFGYAHGFPAAQDAAALAYDPPWDLAAVGCDDIDSTLHEDHSRFALAGCVRLFERLQWLRGMERLMLDLMEDHPALYALRDRVHEFNLRNLAALLDHDVDAIQLMDDWGSQRSMLISPRTWRKVFAPCYRDMFARVHAAGKLVFFHTDGFIEPIVEDLVELGVDALNCQVTCMDAAGLGRRFAGRVCFWGEPDRQHTLPYGTPEQVHREVRDLVTHLATPEGGMIGLGTAMPDVSLTNLEAMLAAWNASGEGTAIS